MSIELISKHRGALMTVAMLWLAINTGTDSVNIDGYPITPGEGLDYTNLHPDVIWNNEIKIILTSTNSKVRLTRLYYTKL